MFVSPHREEEKKLAGMAQRRFACNEGDLPTLLNVYDAWTKTGRNKAWADRNYLSQRTLLLASSVRNQLASLMDSLGVDTSLSCSPNKEPYLRCLTAALFLNVAKLVVDKSEVKSQGPKNSAGSTSKFSNKYSTHNKTVVLSHSGGQTSQDLTAPYRTLRNGETAHLHPSSVLFSGPRARRLPEHVVFAELLITSKRYMRCVTAVEGAWLLDSNPDLFKQ